MTNYRLLLLTFTASAIAFSSTSCTTTETAAYDNEPAVIAAAGAKPEGKWGGVAGVFQKGMGLTEEPTPVRIDPKVDYVDYAGGIVSYSLGNKKTFHAPAPKEEEEVEFKKIGF